MTTGMRHFSRSELAAVAIQIVGERLPGRPEQAITVSDAVQNYVIGSRRVDTIGRVLRYAHVSDGTNGPTNAPTQVRRAYGVSSVIWAGTIENSVTAVIAVAGDTQISYTTIGIIPENFFQGGLIEFGGASYGFQVPIASHPAALAGATLVITLKDPLPANVALGAAATLYRNPFADIESPRQGAIEIIAAVNSGRQAFLGVPQVDALAGEFCWVQVKGPAIVVSGSGAEGTNLDERQLVWDRDGSVELAAIDYITAAPGQSRQHAGYILPATNSALVMPAVGVPGGPNGALYMYLECGD